MDAQTFLGMEPAGDDRHWRMVVEPQLTTPGNFLFGGCGLGASVGCARAGVGTPHCLGHAGHYLSYARSRLPAGVGGHAGRRRGPSDPGPEPSGAWGGGRY